MRLGRAGRKPAHDCRQHLPSADTLPEGEERRCPECGSTNRRRDYEDDYMEWSATYCTWDVVPRREIEDRLEFALADRDTWQRLADGHAGRAESRLQWAGRLLRSRREPAPGPPYCTFCQAGGHDVKDCTALDRYK